MKAWKVSNKVKENIEPEIIYAENSKEALVFSTLYYDDNDFVELVAEHIEYADDKEDLSEGDYLVMLLENGWEYPEYGVYILDSECITGDVDEDAEYCGTVSLTKDDIEGLKEFGIERYLFNKLNVKVGTNMKAWKVTNVCTKDIGSELVFANTATEAIALAEIGSISKGTYELEAERAEYADNKEDLSDGDLTVLLLENNWEFEEYPVYGVDDFYGVVSLTKEDIVGIKEKGFDSYLISKVDE